MSVRSGKRRRAKRRADRRFWMSVVQNGAWVAPDVWESLKAQARAPRAEVVELFGYPAGSARFQVSPVLPPGTVVAMPPKASGPQFTYQELDRARDEVWLERELATLEELMRNPRATRLP